MSSFVTQPMLANTSSSQKFNLMKNNEKDIQEKQIISERQAVQKKLDKANETLRSFTKEQIREAFAKSRTELNA